MPNSNATRRTGRMLRTPAYAAVIMAVTLAACGDAAKRDAGAGGQQSQTVARVNGQEITVHELEAELRRRAPIQPEEREAAAKDALRRLVQRTVLAQKAVSLKLDRRPEVMMELRRKRAEILAQAYLSETLSRQLPVSKTEVTDFVEQHPHYFTERKYYVFDQLLIEKALVTDEVMTAIKDLETLEQVEQALERLKIPFSRRLNSNTGNQFSREMAARLDTLNPDEVFFIKTRDFAVISKLVGRQARPVTGGSARKVAERLLDSNRNAAAGRKAVQGLLAEAKIEFFGDFSQMRVLDAAPADGAADPAGTANEAEDGFGQDGGAEESGR